MYLDYYGFKEKPFELSPEARFLYLGENHREALALLTYGVKERKGLVVLTGEVGTGKSTMVRALLNNLNQNIRHVVLTNPALSTDDLLHYIAFSLGLDSSFHTKWEFLVRFEDYLNKCLKRRENIVLIMDEAQHLPYDVLEELRLLSNMETGSQKLLNIFLIGQPELSNRLRQPQYRALFQRVSIRYHITPLNAKETAEYIKTRVKKAGGPSGLFPKKVVKTIYLCSKGYPRVINVLCDNILLSGYVEDKKKLTPDMVYSCHEEMGQPFIYPDPVSKNSEAVTKSALPGNQSKKAHRKAAQFFRTLYLLLIVIIIVLGISIFFAVKHTKTGREIFEHAKMYFIMTPLHNTKHLSGADKK